MRDYQARPEAPRLRGMTVRQERSCRRFTAKVKQEFAAKEKAKPSKPARKPEPKAAKKPAA